MSSIENRTQLLLALLYARTDQVGIHWAVPITGITRLEKLVFLLKVQEHFLPEVTEGEDFHFIPFRMGPWSEAVYDEVDFLESIGLLEKRATNRRNLVDVAHDNELFSEAVLDKYQQESSYPDEETVSFSLSKEGMNKARIIWDRLSDDEKSRIVRVKQQFNNMNLQQFLRFIYKTYPAYAKESEIVESLGLKRREAD